MRQALHASYPEYFWELHWISTQLPGISSITLTAKVVRYKSDRYSGVILSLRSANEKRCYKVTSSPIDWAQT